MKELTEWLRVRVAEDVCYILIPDGMTQVSTVEFEDIDDEGDGYSAVQAREGYGGDPEQG